PEAGDPDRQHRPGRQRQGRLQGAPRESPVDSEVLTWPRYADAARELAAAIVGSGYHADVVLAIARGGLIPAGSLSYALSVKNTSVVNVEYYTGVNERLDLPVILPPALDLVDLADARMLVVD